MARERELSMLRLYTGLHMRETVAGLLHMRDQNLARERAIHETGLSTR